MEYAKRVSPTCLVHVERNRYSVPCEWVNQMVSLRVYPETLLVVAQDGSLVRLTRSFERDQTIYDWQHYIELIQRKPGALRNGAPFKEMPAPLQELQRQLLKWPTLQLLTKPRLTWKPSRSPEALPKPAIDLRD